MSASDRTYSFRAPADLADRLAAARQRFNAIANQSDDVDGWLIRELQMAFARRLRQAPEITRDQSAFIRAAVEMMLAATEKVATGLELADEYAAVRREDPEAEAFADGALRAAAPSWHHE